MRTIENIRTAIALFIMKCASKLNKLADFVQPPYKRVALSKDMLRMVTSELPDRTLVHKKMSPMAEPVEIDRSELAKAIKTAEPLVDQDAEFERQYPYLVERTRKTK